MIDALLRERGLRTGRYTSPHLASMRERICVDGEPLDRGAVRGRLREVLPYVQLADSASRGPPLSFFEVLTAMAFAVFADAPVDVAIVEVGMGGTWDATNVADGSVAVVTPISMDHTRYLGDTVELIAAEKAGIIKPGAVAVLAQQPVRRGRGPAAPRLGNRRQRGPGGYRVRGPATGRRARRPAADPARPQRDLSEDLFLPLFGAHQASNAACALAAVEAFAGVPAGDAQPPDGARPSRLEWRARASLRQAFAEPALRPAGWRS